MSLKSPADEQAAIRRLTMDAGTSSTLPERVQKALAKFCHLSMTSWRSSAALVCRDVVHERYRTLVILVSLVIVLRQNN